jgi:Ser/Thr protein kinase RdoA (MazF antagonist)
MLEASQAAPIADRYGLGADAVLSGPTARGEQGQMWKLQTSRGTWAVKEPFRRPEEADIAEATAFQEAADAAGVPLPAIVRTVDGRVLADIAGTRVRVYDWVDFDERDADLDPVAVGRLIATIHNVPFLGSQPVDPWFTDPVGADRWDELCRALAAAKAPFAEQMAEFRHERVALEELLEPPTDLQTCHRDLWADNVRRTTTGDLCVIDWDDCGLSDPSQELCLILYEFSLGDAGRARALYSAYVDSGGPGRVDRPGDFSTVIAQLGHIGESSCAAWLAADSPHERERNVARVHEFATDRPLTRSVIDGILDAIAGLAPPKPTR